jgi:hypothetical protein
MEGEMKHRCAHVVLSTILRAGLLREGRPYRINLYDAVHRFTLLVRATTQHVVLIMPSRGRLSEERYRYRYTD